ncbi:MAG: phosphatase PAP2 family protein [Candidatus Kapabacteria bacterium]|jgi:membrane-associated phospholipid phosphatase|nr:phosphatase PAP2 family protein [Candidatus Kapabacteria bacterium]
MSNTRLFLNVAPTTGAHLYAVIAVFLIVTYTLCKAQSTSLRDTLSPTLVSAEQVMQPAQADIGTIILQDFRHALNDAGMYFTAPLRFQAKDWLLAAGTLGASASLLPLDESINSVMLRNRSAAGGTSVVGTAAEIGRLYGELWVSGSIGAGLYVVGLAAQNPDVRVTGRLALEALAFGGALNITLKALFGRSRPYLEEGAFAFRPVQITDSRMAFPSGHATVAFAMSAVLAERIGNPWIGAGLYALAGLTAVSRLYHTQHWASDVVLGAAIGAGAGLLVTHLERQRINAVSTGQQVLIYPTLTGLGVTVYFAGR